MGAHGDKYFEVLVQSVYSGPESGKHGPVHMRPVAGQGVDTNLYVECSKEMRDLEKFPVGSYFLATAKYSNKQGGVDFLKAPYHWGYSPQTPYQAKQFLRSFKN
jgi:hypothetical protein